MKLCFCRYFENGFARVNDYPFFVPVFATMGVPTGVPTGGAVSKVLAKEAIIHYIYMSLGIKIESL